MARYTTTVRVSAPQAAVFNVFSDLDRAADRVTGIVRVEKLTDGATGKGTRFRETRVVFKKEATEEFEITDFEPPRRYVVGAESCGCAYKTTFHFVPNGNVTDVDVEVIAEPVTFMAKLVSPLTNLLFSRMMAKCMAKDLDELKQVAERGAADPAPDAVVAQG